MKVYSNMPMQAFIAELRDVAIKAGATTLFLDKIDDLRGRDEDEAHISELEIELDDKDSEIAALREEIDELKSQLAAH